MTSLAMIPGFVLLTTLLGDWFDRWRDRHTIRMWEGELLPKSRWTFFTFRDRNHGDQRGFMLRLSSYAWEEDNCRMTECWHERILFWTSTRGWWITLAPT